MELPVLDSRLKAFPEGISQRDPFGTFGTGMTKWAGHFTKETFFDVEKVFPDSVDSADIRTR